MKKQLLWILSLALALVMIATTVLSAKADPPDRYTQYVEWYEIDTELCEFDITEHGYGTIRYKDWYDDLGNLVKAAPTYGTIRVDWYTTSEKVLNVLAQGPITYEFLSSSELLIKMAGTNLFVVVPGYGPASGDTGLTTILFHLPDEQILEYKSTADRIYDEQDRQAICDYLRP